METVMIVVCITQMIVNILLYALVLSTDQKMKRKLQRQRSETLEWLQRQQEWMDATRPIVRRGSSGPAADDRTVAMRSLLLDSKRIENAG
jgi:hypothetical protein